MILPVQLQPGVVHKRETDQYPGEREGRWFYTQLVRFVGGRPATVEGWQQHFTDAVDDGSVRRLIAWDDDSGAKWVAAGSATGLWVYDADSPTAANSDITPAGFTAGLADGTATVDPATWSLDTWGQYLVGCSSADGALYEWQLDTGTPAAALSNAPSGCQSLVVTDERFIFAIGAGGEARRIEWCDQEDNTTWTSTLSNQAGGITLAGDGRLLAGIRGASETLILSTSDAYAAQYVGQPFVYSFRRIGQNCPIIGPNAVAAIDNLVVWMGPGAFYLYDGQLRTLPCDVDEWVYGVLPNTEEQWHKVFAVPNKRYNEIWWFFPGDSNEPDRYVIWNYAENHWSLGSMSRTAAVDRGIVQSMLMADRQSASSTVIDAHNPEYGHQASEADAFAVTSTFRNPQAREMHLKWIYPDWQEGDSVDVDVIEYDGISDPLSFTVLDTATGATSTARLPLRCHARRFRLRFKKGANNTGEHWWVGEPKIDFVQGSRR